ncbi:Glycosyl transferase family 1 [Priestia megaterium]|uniref:glycosyltransferase n=1 Tax=Priestia megaterium TaxID=1404 RepID=UPI0039E09538
MKILHYNLGLPPYRSGGLTKYSIDLMLTQAQEGHEVNVLYPGKLVPGKGTTIKGNKKYKDIYVYEIINPLPVPLLGGVSRPSIFMKSLKSNFFYKEFLKKLQPDIIHLHTLMGLHYEFIKAAKELGIKVILTSHDYYGICPKVNLIDHTGNVCDNFNEGLKCVTCNTNAYSLPLIYFMQSYIYKNLKDSKVMKKIRSSKKRKFKEETEHNLDIEYSSTLQKSANLANEFKELRKYYINMINMMDRVHFNSRITKEVYTKYISGDLANEIIPITHIDIEDQRKKKEYKNNEQLQIGFLGPLENYKGFPLLRKSLSNLLKEKEYNWHLHVFGNDVTINLEGDEDKDFISFHGRYKHKDLTHIFEKIDILIVPSIWKETFGFIGLEALSHGIPLIVTTYVGIKDLIHHNQTGLVIKPTESELSKAILYVIQNRDQVQKWNHNICSESFDWVMSLHNKSIEVLYQKVVGEKV